MADEQQQSEQNELTQQQEDDAFNAGFDSVRNPDEHQGSPERRDEDDGRSESDDSGKESTPASEPAAEEAVFAGMTEPQIKMLLERAARVDAIEEQLQKAHGKIGELNRTMMNLQSRPAEPTPQAPASVDDEFINEFEAQFPEFAPAVEARARRIAQEVMSQAQSGGVPVSADEIGKQVNLAVMDATNPGWRETVQSTDFSLWIATQPDDVRQTYATTWDHGALGKIVSGFKQHQAAGAVRTNKSKQRLEAALTPESRGGRITHAISDEDAFAAGFESVRNPKFYT